MKNSMSSTSAVNPVTMEIVLVTASCTEAITTQQHLLYVVVEKKFPNLCDLVLPYYTCTVLSRITARTFISFKQLLPWLLNETGNYMRPAFIYLISIHESTSYLSVVHLYSPGLSLMFPSAYFTDSGTL